MVTALAFVTHFRQRCRLLTALRLTDGLGAGARVGPGASYGPGACAAQSHQDQSWQKLTELELAKVNDVSLASGSSVAHKDSQLLILPGS